MNLTPGPNDTPENGVYEGSFVDLGQHISDSSIDIIYTDPPYHDEYLYLYKHLAELAIRVLVDGGYIIMYTGNDHLHTIIDFFRDAGLTYYRMFCKTMFSSNQLYHAKQLFLNWRPVLCFSKGKGRKHAWMPDAMRDQRDKSHHRWGQSERVPLRWLGALTWPESVVLDPFVGGGTIPSVCVKLGIRYIGIDVDPEAICTTRERLSHIQLPLITEVVQLNMEEPNPERLRKLQNL